MAVPSRRIDEAGAVGVVVHHFHDWDKSSDNGRRCNENYSEQDWVMSPHYIFSRAAEKRVDHLSSARDMRVMCAHRKRPNVKLAAGNILRK